MLLTVHMSPVEMELLPLLCLCLLTVSGTTFADGNKPKVIKVTEGSDVILPCSTSNKEGVTSERIEWNKDVEKQVFWYEGEPLPGQDQQFTDRVSLYTSELQHGNASIEIKNTKLSDSGDYTCEIGKLQTNQTFPIQLLVVPLIIKVKEGNSVILPCSPRTKEDVKEDHFEWKKDGQRDVLVYKSMVDGTRHPQFVGRVSLFEDELRNGNASIKINNTKEADSGNYTCEFPDLHETLHILLVVGAVSKPSFSTVGQTKDGIQLQCEVSGASPGFKLKIHWQDGSGNSLTEREIQNTERGESYILNSTVTKTDFYRCVATMEEINHQVYAENNIYVPGGGMSKGAVIGVGVGVLIVIGVISFIFCYKKHNNTDRNKMI